MATFNHSHSNTTNLLSSSSISSISAISQHYERNTTATTTAFLLPSVAGAGGGGGGGAVTTSTAIVAPAPTQTAHSVAPTAVTPLHLDSFVTGAPPPPHFLAAQHHQHHQQHHHTANSSTSSYTLVQIKREPCQVSEVTSATNNSHHHQHHHHQHQQHQLSSSASASMSTQQSITGCSASSSSSSALAATSKTMAALSATTSSTSSTLTTLVKLEPPSPKVHEMDKSSSATAALTATTTNTNSTVPIGIAVARKRPQESNASATLGPASASLPMQQTLNKDLNCFGIRVADLGGVSNGCGSFYFTGNGDLMTGSTTAEEFALSAAAQSVNRAPSTFWQYPNTLPIESVISMSPATVGLQYSREASRGVVLLPATATALGISNFPLYTPTDPFQQAAAAFVWPSYIPQNTAPAALQPPPNFIFPSMSSHSTLQAAPSYATPLQLFGSNYLAAAAAAAAATSTLCQHSQQQTTISAASANGLGRFMNTTTSTSTDLQKSSLLTAASTSGSASMATSSSTTKHITNTGITTMSLAGSHNPMGGLQPLPPPPTATTSLILPPNAMKLEDWSPDFMALAKHTAGGSLHPLGAAPPAHTNTSTSSLIVPAGAASLSGSLLGAAGHPSGLLDLGPSPGGALNLIRLPTPPSSATMESAAAAAVTPQMPQHLLFHPATSTASPTASASATPATALLNLTVTTTPSPATARLTNGTPTNPNCFVGGAAGSVAPSIGPPTPLAEELAPMNFKTDLAGQQFGFGVPRDVAGQQQHVAPANGVLPPQMQDVNIQTDTPVCSEDENSSCPLAIQQQQQQQLQPANGDVTSTSHSQTCNSHQTSSVDAGELTGHKDREDDQQPLELTKTNEGGKANGSVQTDSVVGPVGAPECHRREEDKTNHAAGLSETGPLPKENNNYKKAQPVGEADPGLPPMPTLSSASSNSLPVTNNNINSNTSDSRATPAQPNSAEEMTGLELLSNISTSTLVKTVQSSGNMPLMRIKQEPVDHSEIAHPPVTPRMVHEDELHHQQPEVSAPTPPQPPPPAVEAFGGLNLLCALAEQRIQEEVQTSGLFDATGGSTPTPTPCNTSLIKMNNDEEEASPLARSFSGFPLVVAQSAGAPPTAYRREHSAFPSMESIELPSTSGAGLAGSAGSAAGANGLMPEPVKRKKHKHSKSSKSAASYSLVAAVAAGGCPTPTKKSQRCSKKSKKKCAKEKHHKHSHKEAAASDLDLNDEALQEDLKNAFNSVDPMYAQRFGKLPDPHEIINMVETSMRLRLADVTRQYRKKKRKLDEISKNKLAKKKRKKCSKLAAAAVAGAVATEQAINGAPASAATGLTLTGGVAGGPASSFPAFANSAVAVTSPYLHNNTFLRFGDKSTNILARTQFPPPPTPSLLAASGGGLSESGATAGEPGSDPMPTPLPAYKPVRLEPSALAAAEQSRAAGGNASSSSVMRLAAKHPSSEKLGGSTTPAKERKLNSSSSGGGRSRHSSGPEVSTPAPQPPPKKPNPMDRELILTSEHLYRSETRVLTDMGGLFYAGIMKPLQPPDIYAITLDGERGNKSHIMSREEIFKDTILEVTPKSVDSVPVGTRLCAYWSQQYRCLYPGRAIESETSEDDDTTAPKDFVSVEFDDGDSGRIRLQNIRLLLSDFPIVEYNENPLSTLGKQKKASLGAGAFRSAADPPSLGGQSLDTQHQQQQQFLAQPPAQMGAFSDLQQQQQEQQNAREVYAAKRIERKRKKSLKKKSQQASASASLSPCAAQPADDLTCTLLASSSGTTMNGSDTAATTRTVVAATGAGGSTAGPAGVGESSDCGRKHHKHKKRKKHKKQRHHRKALDSLEGSDECYAVIRSSVGGLPLPPATPFVGKQELDDMDGDGDEDDEDEEEEDEEEVAADQLNGNASRATSVGRHTAFGGAGAAAAAAAAAVDNPMFGKKTYTNGTSAAAAIKMEPTNGVRVKTEHIDYEEETASNLMSEVSDEVKGDDEIEHNNSKGSKIAAFLPDRQLWGWLGKAYRKAGVKGRARKQFYKTIKRGKEKITVGDCAVFLSTGRPDRPYIGRIESMWETSSSNKVVRVRWFYHPEETTGCPDLKYPGALFESPHEDENDVQTISHHCEVLPFERYFGKFGSDSKQYQSIYDNNDTYYLAGYYNPRLKALKLQNDIPTLEEDNTAAANTSSTQNTAIAATQPTAQSAGMAATNTTATTISANTNRQD